MKSFFILYKVSDRCDPIVATWTSDMLLDDTNNSIYKNLSNDQIISPKYHYIETIPRDTRNLFVTKTCQNRDQIGKHLRYSIFKLVSSKDYVLILLFTIGSFLLVIHNPNFSLIIDLQHIWQQLQN